jgi:hypothetical protein
LPTDGYSLKDTGNGCQAIAVYGSCPLAIEFRCLLPASGQGNSVPCRIHKRYIAGSGNSRYRGELCRGCQWSCYEVVAHPAEVRASLLSSPISFEKETLFNHELKCKKDIAFRKLVVGMAVNELVFGEGRTFVLTESSEVKLSGRSWYSGVHRFMMALRKRYGRAFVYAWVEHSPSSGMQYIDRQGITRISEGHFNRHFVVYGSGFLDAPWLGDIWSRAFDSKVTGLEIVRSKEALAVYMANYLAKGGEEFVKARFSRNWLFEGWWSFSRAYKYHYGQYPGVEYLYRIRMLGRGAIRSQLEGLKLIGFFNYDGSGMKAGSESGQ